MFVKLHFSRIFGDVFVNAGMLLIYLYTGKTAFCLSVRRHVYCLFILYEIPNSAMEIRMWAYVENDIYTHVWIVFHALL